MKIVILLAALSVSLLILSACASSSAERNAPAIGSFVDIDGTNIHVLDLGPRDSMKPPVLLIHGASVNLRDMKIALGDRLAADRRVLIVDRPGRGYSQRPKEGERLAVQARFIKQAVDALGVKHPIVVGQSFGGAVSLAYALDYQSEMSGLVLLAPVSHEWPGGVAWYNRASDTPVIGVFLRRLIIPIYGRLVGPGSVDASFGAGGPAPEDYYNQSGLPLLFRPKDFKSNAADLARLKPQIVDMQTKYGGLALPVAIVTGDADETVSPQIHAMTLAKEVQGAELTVLEGVGHALHHQRTDEIISIIDALGAR